MIANYTISEIMRVVCYYQPIYNDLRLETVEFAGLSLGIRRNSTLAFAKHPYDQAAIMIIDDDGKVLLGHSCVYLAVGW